MSNEHEKALEQALDGLSLPQLEALYFSLLRAETVGIRLSIGIVGETQEEKE